MKKVIAELRAASKEYKSGDDTIIALNKTDISIRTNELSLILGPSGSGKTTLISLLGCVIYPSSGEVYIDGKSTKGMTENDLADMRLKHIGFVFQNFNLIQPLNALENVILPLTLSNVPYKEAKERATKALNNMNLENRLKNLPKMLSGGQQQRVAIARALVTDPQMILCDEPTAALDHESIKKVMSELKSLSESGKAVVIVTHDERLKAYADRIIHVENGIATELNS